VACTGATPVAATNCLNFGNPQKPEIMAQLSLAIDGIAEACNALGTPVTGGNVSLYNETLGEGIYPTPVIGIVGILDDVTKAVPSSFQAVGDQLIWIFAPADPARFSPDSLPQEMGSTEYAKQILKQSWGKPPLLDLEGAKRLNTAITELANKRLIHSATDVSDGGLPVALARCTFANRIGCQAQVAEPFENTTSAYNFSEDPSVIVTCARENIAAVLETASGLGALMLGHTTESSFVIYAGNEPYVASTVDELRDAYTDALESALAEEVLA
jgi:phosphoribosylformylglycinamidine synthase